MKIILSPTKKMKEDLDFISPSDLPEFLPRTEKLLSYLRGKTPEGLQKLWGCNDAIARQNIDRLQDMDLRRRLTPAVLAYEGIAFQHMAPTVFSEQEMNYVQDHLRILSAFYGVLKPLDGIRSYRLEMQAPAAPEGFRDLYDFWGQNLYQQVRDDSGIILNLASKEYYRCIEKYLQEGDRFITCVFGEIVNGKLKQKATFAKMARGEMVRFLAETQTEQPEDMQKFSQLGFHFSLERSSETEYVFLRELD